MIRRPPRSTRPDTLFPYTSLVRSKQLYDFAWRELPGYALARDWLRANIPDDFHPGIIHGDVGTPNALFAFDPPCRLTALIDWELSTIADPLLDLAWFCHGTCDERFPDHVPEKTLGSEARRVGNAWIRPGNTRWS